MTCGFCGTTFEEDRGQPACRSCPLAGSCRFVRCPECGYENPVPPSWLRRREGRGKDAGEEHDAGGRSHASWVERILKWLRVP